MKPINGLTTAFRSRKIFSAAICLIVLGGCSGGDGDNINWDSLAYEPVSNCTMTGIGSVAVKADESVTLLEVVSGSTTGQALRDRAYCLVKARVGSNVNIWVSLPSSQWNGRLRAEGNGVYAGSSQLTVAEDSVRQGFVGVKTDTGHAGTARGPLPDFLDGSWGMSSPGVANEKLQEDFAHRSMHLMAVVGKQVAAAFYGRDPVRSYWYGCSTGGRQGLMMAQRYPEDFDAILAGAPAVHWDRFHVAQLWPQVAMATEAGGLASTAKQSLATERAVASCDANDGVKDGVIEDPRTCSYDPTVDATLVRADCPDDKCLTPGQASAIKKIWEGPRNTSGAQLWSGLERGTSLGALAGQFPFPVAVDNARFWVYLNPAWSPTSLTYQNFETLFADSARIVGPRMATDNPDLSAFKARGGKLIMYHGWSDNLIMPGGTVKYFETLKAKMGDVSDLAQLYMVPGMAHCSGGTGINDFGQSASGGVPSTPTTDVFRALMDWSEKGQAPKTLEGARIVNGVTERTRPLCAYPKIAKYSGTGSSDSASNFTCVNP